MAIELWDSRDLFELRQDMRLDPIPNYFQVTYFGGTPFYAEDGSIKFADLPVPNRKLAPFVMPTSQGKPIFERRGETVEQFTPAYIKPKDVVRPTDARNVLPHQIWREGGSGGLPSLQERFDMRVAEVVAYHDRAIRMQWAWMCARSFIDASLTIVYHADQGEDHPEVTIDFGRDASLDITLSGSFWSDPDYDIVGDLTTWSNLMYGAKYGGRPVRLIVGSDVVPYIQKNNGIKDLMTTQRRGSEDTTVRQGMLNVDEPLSYVGTIGGIGQSIEIWTYKDVVEAPNGDMVDILNPKDVLLIAPGAGGVMCFGAIYDIDAFADGNISMDIFPKMFKGNGDPGDMYVMHQSSPLPVNTNPNKVLKARVLS